MLSNKNKYWLSFVASILIGCFFWSDIVSANPLLGSSYQAPFATDTKLISEIQELEIPASFGTISERHVPSSPSKLSSKPSSFIIHIQDAHTSLEAQTNIKNILNYVHDKHGVDLVLVEGAIGKLNPALLNYFSEKELNNKAIEMLAEKGVLGGPELFLFDQMQKGHSQVKAYGVEDLDLYKKNLSAFREVYSQKQKAEQFLDGLKMKLSSSASRVFSKKLKDFFKEWLFYQDNHAELMRYLGVLKKNSKEELRVDFDNPRSQKDFPQLSRYYAIQRLEKNRKEAQSAAEFKSLMAWAKKASLKKELIEDLQSWRKNNRLSRSLRTTLEELYMEGSSQGFDFKLFEHLSADWGISILQSELQADDLLNEIQKLSWQLLDQLAQSHQEKILVAIYKGSLILKKCFSLELSREEYREVIKKKSLLKPYALAMRLKAVEGSENVPYSAGEADFAYEKALEFYQLAVAREEKLFQRTIERMKQEGQTKAALITGGFHSKGLQDYLKEAGLSYVEMTPRISEMNSDQNYLRLMLNDLFKKAHLKNPLLATDPALQTTLPGAEGFDGRFVLPVLEELRRSKRGTMVRSEVRNEEVKLLRAKLLEVIREPLEFLSKGDDLESNRPGVFLVLGNPDLKAFLEFAKTWKEKFEGVPIVLAGGRGRGTAPLVHAILNHYGERLQEEEREWLNRALNDARLYESDLLQFIFTQEGIDKKYLKKETQPSKNTSENFSNSLTPIDEVIGLQKGVNVGIVSAPPLLNRIQLTAQNVWKDQREDWTSLRVQAYSFNLDSMSAEDLINWTGYAFGYSKKIADQYPKPDGSGSFLNTGNELGGIRYNLAQLYQEKEKIPVNLLNQIDSYLEKIDSVHALLARLIKASAARYDARINRFVISARSEVRNNGLTSRRKFLGGFASVLDEVKKQPGDVGVRRNPASEEAGTAFAKNIVDNVQVDGLELLPADKEREFFRSLEIAARKLRPILNSEEYKNQGPLRLKISNLRKLDGSKADKKDKDFGIYAYRADYKSYSQAFFFDLKDIDENIWKDLLLVLADLENFPNDFQSQWRSKLPLDLQPVIISEKQLTGKARNFNRTGFNFESPQHPRYNYKSDAQAMFERYLRKVLNFLPLPEKGDVSKSLGDEKDKQLQEFIKNLIENGIKPKPKDKPPSAWRWPVIYGSIFAGVIAVISCAIIFLLERKNRQKALAARTIHFNYFTDYFERIVFRSNRIVDIIELGHFLGFPLLSRLLLGINSIPKKNPAPFRKKPSFDSSDDNWDPRLAYVSLRGNVRNLYGWPSVFVILQYWNALLQGYPEAKWRYFPQSVWAMVFNLVFGGFQIVFYLATVLIAYWGPSFERDLGVAGPDVLKENTKRLFDAVKNKNGSEWWVQVSLAEYGEITRDQEVGMYGLGEKRPNGMTWISEDGAFGEGDQASYYINLTKLEFDHLPDRLKKLYQKQIEDLVSDLRKESSEVGINLKFLNKELNRILKKLNSQKNLSGNGSGGLLEETKIKGNRLRLFLFERAYSLYKAMKVSERTALRQLESAADAQAFAHLPSAEQIRYFIPLQIALKAHRNLRKSDLKKSSNPSSNRSEVRFYSHLDIEPERLTAISQAVWTVSGGIISRKVQLDSPELFDLILRKISPHVKREEKLTAQQLQKQLTQFEKEVNVLKDNGDLIVSAGAAVLDADLFEEDPDFALLSAAFQAKFADNQTLVISGYKALKVEKLILELFNKKSKAFNRLSSEDRARLRQGIHFEPNLAKARLKANRQSVGAVTYQNLKEDTGAAKLDLLPFVQLRKEEMSLIDRAKAQFLINQLIISASQKIAKTGDIRNRLMMLAVEINKQIPDAVTLTEDGKLAQISSSSALRFFNVKAYQRLQASA